jgi:hypothetical protein
VKKSVGGGRIRRPPGAAQSSVVVVVVVVLRVVDVSSTSPARLLAPASSSPTLVEPEAAQLMSAGVVSAIAIAKSNFFHMISCSV